jgi:hypothetical protein
LKGLPTGKAIVGRKKDFHPNSSFVNVYDKAAELTHGTWVSVTGTIKIVGYQGEKLRL